MDTASSNPHYPSGMATEAAVPVTNAMSVDVEDYFQVSAFERHIDRADWDRLPCRVEQNTNRILDLFASHGVRSTFFTLGWVAERYPGLVRRIVDEGHELASHGYGHQRVTQLSRDEFRSDIRRAKAILEDLSGQRVQGYRAPSYSIVRDNQWAFDILIEEGHAYSSSVYPIAHDLYGIPDAPRFPYAPRQQGFTEIPITTLRYFGRNFPCGGGGYFRLFPYFLSKWAIGRFNQAERRPAMFYFHPWEVDPEQPRQRGVGLKSRFRHYLNLQRTYGRIARLLADFHWDRVDRVYLDKQVGN